MAPRAGFDDPANNFMYEAHQYFDSDESGTYRQSYDAELARNPDLLNVGKTRVSHFVAWCQSNRVRGIVDEFGIPYNDPRWAAVLENFFGVLDAAGMDGAYWAAGEWWPLDRSAFHPAHREFHAGPAADGDLAGAPRRRVFDSALGGVAQRRARRAGVAGYGLRRRASQTRRRSSRALPIRWGWPMSL